MSSMLTMVDRLRTRRGATLLRIAVVVMALAASYHLISEFHRLIFDDTEVGAIDLKQRTRDVREWFAGEEIYQRDNASYPPATLIMLWPLVGWPSWIGCRWLWAVTSIVALAAIIHLLVKACGPTRGWERAFVVLLPLSMNATGTTIGNGQLIVHQLPALLASILVLAGKPGRMSWTWAVVAFLFALVKPTVTAPFFWIVLFAAGGVRAAAAIAIGYVTLTLAATTAHGADAPTLLQQWSAQSADISARAAIAYSYGTVHSWLITIGQGRWITAASLGVFAALGAWTYRHRRADPWLLLAVAAVASRVWTYHGLYDNLLLLLPMVCLLRIARRSDDDRTRGAATMLLATLTLVMMAPVGLLFFTDLAPLPNRLLFSMVHTSAWALALAFLLGQARVAKATVIRQ